MTQVNLRKIENICRTLRTGLTTEYRATFESLSLSSGSPARQSISRSLSSGSPARQSIIKVSLKWLAGSSVERTTYLVARRLVSRF